MMLVFGSRTMKPLLALLLVAKSTLQAVDLTLTSPLDYQVTQRSSPGKGLLRFAGELVRLYLPSGSESVDLDDIVLTPPQGKPRRWTFLP